MFRLAMAFLPFLFLDLHSQNVDPTFRVTGKIGYVYQQSSYLEGGVLIYQAVPFFVGNAPIGLRGVYAGAEMRVGGHKFIMGPKISLEEYIGPVGVRIASTYLTDFNQGCFNISPEIGLTEAGTWYVLAGYNWTLNNRAFWNVTGFRISIGFNFCALQYYR